MANISDDIYMGSFYGANGVLPIMSSSADPTVNNGVGPMGRVVFRNIVPLTANTTNIAASQHTTLGVGLTLAAGTGTTLGSAPDGSGRAVILFDVPRCPSLTSAGGNNFSAVNFTATGFDFYGRPLTAKRTGPNGSTVNFTKAFQSLLSIVPDTTDGVHNVSAGSSDIFGLSFAAVDAGYVLAKWANALDLDAGTFVVADTTSPATSLTGDTRGTYLPSSASDGVKRLVIWQHLWAAQCGPNATVTDALGVTPA